MKLIYVPKLGFVGPPAPWPGCDHDEPDPKVAEAKLKSKFYRREREVKERSDSR